MTTPLTDDPTEELRDRFNRLVLAWRAGTGGLSSPRAIASHPTYREIISMGDPALPLILEELRDNGGWWYPALRAITGENPVPPDARGNPPANARAWVDWGRKRGHIPRDPSERPTPLIKAGQETNIYGKTAPPRRGTTPAGDPVQRRQAPDDGPRLRQDTRRQTDRNADTPCQQA